MKIILNKKIYYTTDQHTILSLPEGENIISNDVYKIIKNNPSVVIETQENPSVATMETKSVKIEKEIENIEDSHENSESNKDKGTKKLSSKK